MGCLAVIANRIGGIVGAATRVGGISVVATNVCGIHCRMGLVCGTNLGENVLWASDGVLLTVNKEYLIVKRT